MYQLGEHPKCVNLFFLVVGASRSLVAIREQDAPTTNFIFACIGMLPQLVNTIQTK